MNPLRIKSLLIAMAALVAFASAIAAQVTGGAVTGTVLDPDGSAVVGATVSLKDKSRGLDFTAQTTGAGSYQFTNVPTGTYTMTVTATGFTESTGQVLVSLNQTVTADVALTITAGTAVVNVTGGIENIVQTDTSQVATTFQQRQFQDLPVNQNPNNLALLAPNVTSPPIGVSGEGAITGGLRQRSNSFSIDGVDNNDVGVSGSVRGVIPDTVSEFSFLQNNFNAEFSSGGAGLFNTITKSGTNTYHGSVFGYFAQAALIAGFAHACIALDQLQIFHLFAAGETGAPVLYRTFQVIMANVIGAAFEQCHSHRRFQRSPHGGDVAIKKLILQSLGTGGNDNLAAAKQRRNQISKGLSCPGARFGNENRIGSNGFGYCLCHFLLLRAHGIAGHRARKYPVRRKKRIDIRHLENRTNTA